MRNIFGITSLSLLTVLTAAAAGCGTQVTDTEDNINPPVLKIITPTRGTMGDKMASVQVTGTAIPQLAELNIGHYLIGEAIFTGLDVAVRHMRELMDTAR